MPAPNNNPIIGKSRPNELPLYFLQKANGSKIRNGMTICEIVAHPPVRPPLSNARCGIQNKPHIPAATNKAKLIE